MVSALALRLSSQRGGWSEAAVLAAVALSSLVVFAVLAFAALRRSLTLTAQDLDKRSGLDHLKLHRNETSS